MTLRAARIRVPCSTSNLGSGYDTIGLALDRHLQVAFEPDDSGSLTLERSGSLTRLEGDVHDDLVACGLREGLSSRGVTPSGVLRVSSDFPVARGLGASAAARLAGYDLARAVLGEPRDDDGAFRAALQHEGHPDNAAPSLFGGLRAVAATPDGPVVIRLHLSPSIGFAYAAPAARISTKEARDILPRHVPHALAASSLGRLAALIRGLAEGNPELIRIGMKDELHVPHRLSLIPGALSAMSAATDAGAWAVTISGAGSGLIAACDPESAADVADAMRRVFDPDGDDPESVGFPVKPSLVGLERLPVDSP